MLIQYQVMLFLFKAPKIATIILTSGTKIDINDVLYSTKFKQNFLISRIFAEMDIILKL